jgi:proteic killer suppression protein
LEVTYRTRHLERCYAEHKLAVREFGADVGRRYIQRINLLKAAQSIDDLPRLPGLRFHALSGDRQGQYAVNLTGFYRLILTLQGSELQIVRIEEVSKHYGD